MIIAGKRLKPGTTIETQLKISESVTHQPVSVPVNIACGIEDGPVIFLTAAVHGDEINGVPIVRQVMDAIDPTKLRGTVVGIPVVNRFGFSTGERYMPDRRDLNRAFPGGPNGSLAGRIAHILFEKVLSRCDYGIDLHTAAQGRANLCHVRGDGDSEKVRNLMRAFGTPIIIQGEGPKGSLRRACTDAGIPTMIFEAGEPNRFEKHVAEIGIQGVFRVLKNLGMYERRVPKKPSFQVLIKNSDWIRSDHGGIVELLVNPGDLVRRGQCVARVLSPFGREVDQITSTLSGVVLSTNTLPLTRPGEAMIHVGQLKKSLKHAREFVKEGGDLGHTGN
jgi:predicted deacylase